VIKPCSGIAFVVGGSVVHVFAFLFIFLVTGWRSLLRHCATSRKVTGSISEGVHWNFSLT